MRTPALLALFLLVASHAQAQASLPVTPVASHITIAAEDPGRAFQPGGLEPVTLSLTYTTDPGGQPAPNTDPNSPSNTMPTQVTFEVKTKPSWVRDVTFVPAVLNFSVDPTNPRSAATARAMLNVSDDAPALVREEFIVVAKAAPNGNIGPDSKESASINLRAAVVTKINVTPPKGPFVVRGGRGVAVPFVVKNLGNSNVTARLNVTTRPQDSVVEAPATIDLPRNGTGTVEVIVRLPWTYGEQGTIELEATPITENDDGKPIVASVDLAGQSAVPGAPLAAMLVVLAVVAIARRAR